MFGEVPDPIPPVTATTATTAVTQYSPDVDDLVQVRISIGIEEYKKRTKEEEEEKKKEKKQRDKDEDIARCGIYGIGLFIYTIAMCGFYYWVEMVLPTDPPDEIPEHLIISVFALGGVGILSCCCGVRSRRKWRRTPTYIAQQSSRT